jgi:hypothetical protein
MHNLPSPDAGLGERFPLCDRTVRCRVKGKIFISKSGAAHPEPDCERKEPPSEDSSDHLSPAPGTAAVQAALFDLDPVPDLRSYDWLLANLSGGADSQTPERT